MQLQKGFDSILIPERCMQTMQAHVASSTRDFFAIDRYSGILHRKRLSDIRQDMLR